MDRIIGNISSYLFLEIIIFNECCEKTGPICATKLNCLDMRLKSVFLGVIHYHIVEDANKNFSHFVHLQCVNYDFPMVCFTIEVYPSLSKLPVKFNES